MAEAEAFRDSCSKAQFDCSYAKKALKPGPKGPRAATSNRIRKKLHDIRAQAAVPPLQEPVRHSTSASASSLPRSPNDGTDWFGALPPRTSAPPMYATSVTFDDVRTYLKIYHHKMYPVWPVVNIEEVIARLGPGMQDAKTCALAYSVCAATGAQLRLHNFGSPSRKGQYSIIDCFAQEAERCRALIDVRENSTVDCILIAFFLSMYYSSRKKRITSTLLLREALTLCELLDLDKEAVYATLDTEEQKYRRKIFWLMFVTERGNAMQYDMATILRNTIDMPSAEDDRDPITFTGFLSLVHLFVAVEGTLVGGGFDDSSPGFTTELFTQLQQTLRSEPQMPLQSNEVQRTDITVTQQWMRMLVWQLAMKKVSMTTGSSDDPMSLTYPAHVAKDSLAFLSQVNLDSIIAHGPGMEIKIFEIANTLLDVINCVPSLSFNGSGLMTQGPRDTFHGLSCLLASLSGGQSRSVALLQGKVADSTVPFMPIPRFVEINDDVVTSPMSNEAGSAKSPISSNFLFPTREWRVSPTSLPTVPKRSDSNETFNGGWSQQTPVLLDPGSDPSYHTNMQMPHLGLANHLNMDWPNYSQQT